MEIVDAQVHEPTPVKPWPAAVDDELEVVLACELLLSSMDAVGVDRAVIASARTEFSAYACAAHPDRFTYVAEHDPEAEDVEELVARTLDDPGAVGLRVRAVSPPQHRLTDPPPLNLLKLRQGVFDRLFAAAERHGVPTCVNVAGFLDDLVRVAERHPDLVLIIDHIGTRQPINIFRPPMEIDDPPFRQLPALLSLARHPNVIVKLTGLPTLSTEGYPFRDTWSAVRQIIDAFTPARVMWGSDIQRCRMQFRLHAPVVEREAPAWAGALPGIHTYAEALGFVRESLELDGGTKEAVLGGTARRVFGGASLTTSVVRRDGLPTDASDDGAR